MDRLNQMVNLQRALQANSFIGQDPATLKIDDKIRYIKDMILGLEDELHEVMGEMSWKPWTVGEKSINADGVKKELVDAWHFLMNIMVAVDMSGDELYKMYMKKRAVNEARMESGTYDGKSTKCPGCKRALEDVTLQDIKLPNSDITDIVFCQCGEHIPLEVARPFLD